MTAKKILTLAGVSALFAGAFKHHKNHCTNSNCKCCKKSNPTATSSNTVEKEPGSTTE